MKISVVGMGYVGLSLSVLLSEKHDVTCLDISKEKVDLINNRKSPITDIDLENYLSSKKLNLRATTDKEEAFKNSEFVIIATPTNYDTDTGSFDTSSVQEVIKNVMEINSQTTIIIRSTIPYGFTNDMKKKFSKSEIIFSPEFLRESKALYDNLYPSRIVVGDINEKARKFGNLLAESSLKSPKEVPILYMSSEEAESVKLFSNTYLAMRISYFNELDSFSEIHNLSSEQIIKGVSLDPRIGDYYNNPSFGYGGYCLPKDTKQLLDNFHDIPNSIIKAIVEANKVRKEFIVNSIINKLPKTLGIYRLVMKEGSDNFRESAVLDIIKKIKLTKIHVILYEPYIKGIEYEGIQVIKDLKKFINKSDLIIANRLSKDLENVNNKVYSRDLFREN